MNLLIDRITICTAAPPARVRAVVTGALQQLSLRHSGPLTLKSIVLEEEDLQGEDAAGRLALRLERWLEWAQP